MNAVIEETDRLGNLKLIAIIDFLICIAFHAMVPGCGNFLMDYVQLVNKIKNFIRARLLALFLNNKSRLNTCWQC